METFNRLRELRSKLARRENLPPYCIFHDRTLKEMARALPVTGVELREIVGVGDVTMRKYGRAFLALLNRIRHEKH
jgi:ATP-dependent DNA helicase RecQ